MLLAEGACPRFAHVRERLLNRQPLSLLAIGSSVTGVGSGCTHAVPGICDDSKCPRCCGASCGQWGGKGWARDVLEMVNDSWPHPDHRLRSLGQPGGGLAPLILSCLRDFITFRVDLFLLELAVSGGTQAPREQRERERPLPRVD